MIFTQKIELRPFKKRLIINFSHQCFFVENNYFLNVNVWKFLICQCIKNMGLIYLVFFVCSIRIWKKRKKISNRISCYRKTTIIIPLLFSLCTTGAPCCHLQIIFVSLQQGGFSSSGRKSPTIINLLLKNMSAVLLSFLLGRYYLHLPFG